MYVNINIVFIPSWGGESTHSSFCVHTECEIAE